MEETLVEQTVAAEATATQAPLITDIMEIRFDKVTLPGWIFLGVLIVCGVALVLIARKKQKWTTQMLANAAICMALSFVLSYIRLFSLPQGGSVTAASLLPIIGFAYCYGTVPGLIVGIAHGLLQMIQDPYIIGLTQALLDYPLAFGCIALAGIARKLPDQYGWLVGVLLAGVGRFICHVLSGVVFFASSVPDGMTPFAYSAAYNSFVFVDIAICAVVIAFPQVRAAMRRMTAKNR